MKMKMFQATKWSVEVLACFLTRFELKEAVDSWETLEWSYIVKWTCDPWWQILLML